MNLNNMHVVFVFNWIMLIGLVPLSIFWLRRAIKIVLKKDYSFVALWKGNPPKDAHKFAPFIATTHIMAGVIFLTVFFLVLISGLHYDIWTAIVGITFWMKLFFDFNLSMYAHKVGVFSLLVPKKNDRR